jgi:hypothetical protein
MRQRCGSLLGVLEGFGKSPFVESGLDEAFGHSQKFAVMDDLMQLDLDQSAKFWPIYRDHDAEAAKINDLRVANIQEYARTYNHLTDVQADALIQKALSYQKQRSDLLAKYYDRMKQSLRAVTAARFVQVEN